MRLHLICSVLALSLHAYSWTHPGLLVTDSNIARVRAKLAVEREPWVSSWAYFESLSFSSSSYSPNAVSDIDRPTNGDVLWHDTAAAFNLALRWRVTQEEEYAKAASAILTAWGNTLITFSGGDDRYLSAGLQGYEIANAAELLRDYAPFVQDGWDAFANMAVNELAQLASIQAISVLTENQTAWDFAIDYFKSGDGNGAIGNAISNLVEEPETRTLLGQGQESGRDQGHSALDQQLLAAIGQQAWNQGEDLFAFNDSLILRGAEYFARYNLGHDVPFEAYTNGIVSYTDISAASRGATCPTWELLYAHYVHMKGLEAPWTKAYLNNTLEYFGGYEKGIGYGEGSGHYDGVGWGTLLYRLEQSDLEDLKQGVTMTSSTVPSTSAVIPSPSVTAVSTKTPSTSPTVGRSTDSLVSMATGTITEAESIKPILGHGHDYGHHPSHAGGHCIA
ncbi:chondroitin AC/alginate lyase [Aspergillus floccosus]